DGMKLNPRIVAGGLLIAALATRSAVAQTSATQAAAESNKPAGAAYVKPLAENPGGAAALYASTQPAAVITDAHELAHLYDVYNGLQSFDRMHYFLREARQLIEKHGLNKPEASWTERWQQIESYFAEREYVADAVARDAAESKILQQRDA